VVQLVLVLPLLLLLLLTRPAPPQLRGGRVLADRGERRAAEGAGDLHPLGAVPADRRRCVCSSPALT